MGPLVLLSVALQIACGVHVVRAGRPMYWRLAVRYARFLRKLGRGAQAADLLRDVVKRASLAPKYYQREQREWTELAKRTLQELA